MGPEGAMPSQLEGAKPFQEFPKWVYFLDGTGKIVNNREEQNALGPGWFEQPNQASAAFDSLTTAERLQVLGQCKDPKSIDAR
jgi:hypothetical protein